MINIRHLVNKALAGDERAYRKLVKRYGKTRIHRMLQIEDNQCKR